MSVSLVGQRIDVTNRDALAEELDAAADVRALEISETGGGGGGRVVAFPGRLLEDAEFQFHGGGNGVAHEEEGSPIVRAGGARIRGDSLDDTGTGVVSV